MSSLSQAELRLMCSTNIEWQVKGLCEHLKVPAHCPISKHHVLTKTHFQTWTLLRNKNSSLGISIHSQLAKPGLRTCLTSFYTLTFKSIFFFFYIWNHHWYHMLITVVDLRSMELPANKKCSIITTSPSFQNATVGSLMQIASLPVPLFNTTLVLVSITS